MYRTLRILTVLLLIVTIAGCAATRKRSITGKENMPATADYKLILSEVRSNNITDKGFIIRKGRIEIIGTEFDGDYNFNARVNTVGDFLASVRGPLGIEVIRLIISGEDICAIDRLGRTAYVGKKDAVLKRKGIPDDFIKTIFGDISDGQYIVSDSMNKVGLLLTEETDGFKRETSICADKMKICSERYRSELSGTDLLIGFNDFIESEEAKYASEIVITENLRNILIKIYIDEMSVGYSEDIGFTIPAYKRRSF